MANFLIAELLDDPTNKIIEISLLATGGTRTAVGEGFVDGVKPFTRGPTQEKLSLQVFQVQSKQNLIGVVGFNASTEWRRVITPHEAQLEKNKNKYKKGGENNGRKTHCLLHTRAKIFVITRESKVTFLF